MNRTSSLDDLIRESDDRLRPMQLEEEMGDALWEAVLATRAKIDGAFTRQAKFAARLKGSHG